MYRPLIYLFVVFLACACHEKQQADLIVTNAQVYTVDEQSAIIESFAVKDGRFIAIGTSKEIKENYKANQVVDAAGRAIVPGLIDGHCHFYGLGSFMQVVDLTGTKSYQEVLNKLVDFQKGKNSEFILGRGWDQNDWDVQEFPDRGQLDQLFPDTPVALTRIDGHALLVNKAALDRAGITNETEVEGGEIIKNNGRVTGVLIDGAMSLVRKTIPDTSRKDQIQALKDAESYCFSMGLTSVHDAGLPSDIIFLIDSLQKAEQLKIRMYAMISVSNKNLDLFLEKGPFKTDRLNVRSFKVYADGALGSRGAALKEPYSDRHNHFGAMVTPLEDLEEIAKRLASSDFQMNTHAIGDSANSFILKTYAKELKSQTNRRWRIEHAQVISPADFMYFTEIIPSVQPTHATSDMYWAEDRVGPDRIEGAYAFKRLLSINGRIVLGTDFPVEKVNPMLTFYAAVARQDLEGYPEKGFQLQNGLNRQETLKGMTKWAAYAAFEEDEKGSIEIGKMADFVILEDNIMEIDIKKVPTTKVFETYLNGEKVY